MATQTPNYNLTKPDPNTDYYNIEVHNNNADIIDAALKPAADPALVPTGLTGKLTQWVSWIANRIKAITGKPNWYDNPATTLEDAKTHADAAAPHSGHETPDGAQSKVDALAGEGNTKTVKQLDAALLSHEAECAVLIPESGSTANDIILDIILADKKKGSFRATTNNTGNLTINGKPFKKDASTQIPAGGIKAGKVYDFYFDEASDSVFIIAKASGNSTPSDVLAGKTFSNDDGEQIGTMPNNPSQTATLTISGSGKPTKTVPEGYTPGGTITAQLSSSLASKILAGNTIGGVAGTAIDGTGMKKYATGTMTATVNGTYSVSGLTFRPRMVWVKQNSHQYTNHAIMTDVINQAFSITGTVMKNITITDTGFSIANSNLSGATTWYAWE